MQDGIEVIRQAEVFCVCFQKIFVRSFSDPILIYVDIFASVGALVHVEEAENVEELVSDDGDARARAL